jgi:hypothetical protein
MSEARQLVRSYSIELENTLPSSVAADDLRRVFTDNERQEGNQEARNLEWRTYYEPWKPIGEDT